MVSTYYSLHQKKCLQWIQNNAAAAFVGNPLNVTIWGQSAAASSIGFHLQRYYLNRAQPQLFHQVLFQPRPAGIQPRTLSQSTEYNNAFAKLTSCLDPTTVTTCPRGKTADQILQASKAVKFDVLTYPDKLITVGFPWQATLGLNSFLLQFNNIDFINRYASQITLPVFWGTKKDAGTLFIYEAVPNSIPILYPLVKAIIGGL